MTQKLLVSGLALILAYLSWVWGGLRLGWLLPVVWASCILLGILLAASLAPQSVTASRSRPVWCDLFLWFGLLFLGYLVIQWWNAGRVLYFDVGFNEWRYSPPRHSGWPSAFSRPEAAEMLSWFFPAWVLGLTVRSPFLGARTLRLVLRSSVMSAGLLALFGVVQFTTHTRSLYWWVPMTDDFFASFGYTNHAAAFFVLNGALAAGLLFHEIFRLHPGTLRHPFRAMILAAIVLLCLTGANLSLSRAGVILAWALAAFVATYGLVRGWRKLGKAGRVNLAAATVAVLFIFYFAVAGFGSAAIAAEFKVKKPVHHMIFPVLDEVNLGLGDRPLLALTSIRIWKDHQWLGIGGWGFGHLLSSYVPSQKWEWVKYPGRANVHCDPLQFLVEFGLIGGGLLLAALMTLVVDMFRNTNRRDPIWIMGVIGLSLVVVFSLIDLPFRCPSILCTWVLIFAAIPRVVNQQNGMEITPMTNNK